MDTKRVFGDFQTPLSLARDLCHLLKANWTQPSTIVEPTCGVGSFLKAASEVWPDAKLVGRDISERYVREARRQIGSNADIVVGDFFDANWETVAGPGVMFLGNPPWVTSAELSRQRASNSPTRDNLKRLSGMDALTGKSNFDISEWMILRLLLAGQRHGSSVGMICKASVARRVLEFAGQNRLSFSGLGFWRVDSMGEFSASVDAGFFAFDCPSGVEEYSVPVLPRDGQSIEETWEFIDGMLVRDGPLYRAHKSVLGPPGSSDWRSGLKHDCKAVFELSKTERGWTDGAGAVVDIEGDLVFPFLKATDVFHGRPPMRDVIVTQERVGQDTAWIAAKLPRTWGYLARHELRFSARKSRIYAGKPPFSIFGIGPYSFAPWKVAISGLHKEPRFRLIGPSEGKPVMLDDTSYFIGFSSEDDAISALEFLDSDEVAAALKALVFTDNKRPYTKSVLSRLRIPMDRPVEPKPVQQLLPAA